MPESGEHNGSCVEEALQHIVHVGRCAQLRHFHGQTFIRGFHLRYMCSVVALQVNKYGNIVRRLTESPGYDAEAVLSPDGNTIAFTSMRSGDLELWTMNTDGTELKQVGVL